MTQPCACKAEVERLVLGSLLSVGGIGIDETLLTDADFSHERYRGIFRAIGELHRSGHDAEASAILVQMGTPKDGTAGMLADLNTACFSGSNLKYYADQLKDLNFKLLSEAANQETAAAIRLGEAPETALATLTEKMNQLRRRYRSDDDGARLAMACHNVLRAIEERKPAVGIIRTGIRSVDEISGGLLPGDYVVLAARPSVGKTTLALNIAANVARNTGEKACVVSLEMKAPSLAAKLLAMESGKNCKLALRDPAAIPLLDAEEMLNASDRVVQVAEKIDLYDDTGPDVGPISAAIKSSVRNGAKILILDYLQLMNHSGENRNQQVSAISRWFKATVSALNIPGIALCQLSRDAEKEKRPPKMSDLRDSGSIEQDADVIWFLHPIIDGLVSFIQAKGRNVGIGGRTLRFEKDSQRFSDQERG